MESHRTLENISDGKLYDIDDQVVADAGGCNGCSACCHSVGDLVVLTPYDIYEIKRATKQTFEQLLSSYISLRNTNKLLLPYLKMKGPKERCSFLNSEDRCQIHAHRPNICRLFPLGRVYEHQDFKYFLQVGSCLKPSLNPVQIRNWLQIERYDENKDFILAWHHFIKALTFRVKFVRDEAELQSICNYLIEVFYQVNMAEDEDFYTTFWELLPEAKKYLGIL